MIRTKPPFASEENGMSNLLLPLGKDSIRPAKNACLKKLTFFIKTRKNGALLHGLLARAIFALCDCYSAEELLSLM